MVVVMCVFGFGELNGCVEVVIDGGVASVYSELGS